MFENFALERVDTGAVCPDLRGYGESGQPPSTPDHSPYAKRAMAGDCVALMRILGHERFFVAGHDRGSYVAGASPWTSRPRCGGCA